MDDGPGEVPDVPADEQQSSRDLSFRISWSPVDPSADVVEAPEWPRLHGQQPGPLLSPAEAPLLAPDESAQSSADSNILIQPLRRIDLELR